MSRGTIGGQRLPAPMELGRKRSNIIRTLPVKAGESVAAGDVVDVVGGAAGKTVVALANEKVILSGAATYISVCKLTDTMGVVCGCYGSDGKATLYTIAANGAISFGSDVSFASSCTKVSCVRLSDTQFAVGYSSTSGSYLRMILGTVSASSISFGSWREIEFSLNHCIVPVSSTGGIAICNSAPAKAVYFMVSGATITNGGSSSFPSANITNISACRLPDSGSGKRVCVCYSDGSDGNKGKTVIATISSSNVVTWGTPVEFSAEATYNISCCQEGGYVIAAYTSAGGGGYTRVMTIAGSAISVGATLTLNDTGAVSYTSLTVVAGSIMAAYGLSISGSGDTGSGGYAVGLSRNGSVLTKGAAFRFSPKTPNGLSTAYAEASRALIVYADAANSNYGAATLLEVRDNQIAGGFEESSSEAIALQSGSGGQNIDILYDGVAELPGITAGTSIESPGVRGYAPVDGVLWARPEWDATRASGTYVGTGTSGEYNSNTLEFEFSPTIVVINGNGNTAIAIRGSSYMAVIMNGLVMGNEVTWGENGISWYSSSSSGGANYQLNNAGRQYSYVAL